MVPSIIITPPDAPQIFKPMPVPPKPPRLDWQDELLLQRLREAGSCPVWSLCNAVADEEGTRDRTAGRLLRLELLGRLQRLRRLGLAFPVGRNWISASKPDPAARRPRRRTVRGLRSIRAVSVRTGTGPPGAPSATHEVHRQMVSEPSAPCRPTIGVEKTESGEEPERIGEAARQLARLPRRPKRIWSGWLNDRVRTYRNMPIELLCGDRVYAFGARRGKVVYVREPNMCAGDPDEAGRSWGVVPAGAVEVVRNPHAVLLGRLKAGTSERPSALKAAAARANGRLLPRPGRRRGRPRRRD